MEFSDWLETQNTNAEQKQAVLTRGDLCIRAAAGSGKTRVLVLRILWLLNQEGLRTAYSAGENLLGRILATTFTRKAAGEMKERLLDLLKKLVEFFADFPDQCQFWKDRLDELPLARIGTIDGIAGSLVRQFAKAGFPSSMGADFGILDDLPRETLIEEAIRLTLLEKQKGKEIQTAWTLWETQWGLDAMEEQMADYLRKGRDPAVLKPDSNRPNRPLSMAIIECLKMAHGHYMALCQIRGEFDFSHVATELLRMFESQDEDINGLRAKLSSHFFHILVDEFQDTNDQQWRIINHLAGGLGNGKLTIVGDPQQSIYMFRSADPGVFERIWTLFQRQDNLHSIQLPRNYRTLSPQPMQAINQLTQDALEKYQTYQALLSGFEPVDNRGMVKLMLHDTDEGWCQQVAYTLKGRLGTMWYDVRNKMDIPVRYGDMAILLRSRTKMAEICQALDAAMVPYETPGGVGFWQTQEVRDLVNLVQALADESNLLAMVGVLRGPIGRINDSTILALKQLAPKSLRYGLQRLGDPTASLVNEFPPDGGHLKQLATLWEKWCSLVDRLSHADLIHQVLAESMAWFFFAAQPFGGRVVANVERFLEEVRDFEETTPGSLSQLAFNLGKMVDFFGRIEQADPIGQSDAVKIMTIHGAKGLEFPIVVLADIHNKGNNTLDEPLFLDRFIHFADPDSDDAIQRDGEVVLKITNDEKPPKRVFPGFGAKLQELAHGEIARLFYVGVTRAKDSLYLAGKLSKDKPASTSFLHLIVAALESTPTDKDGKKIDLLKQIAFKANAFGILFESESVSPSGHQTTVQGQPIGVLLADPIRVLPENPVLALGKLIELKALWLDDPTGKLWEDRFVHFVSPFVASPNIGNGVSRDPIPASVVGTLVHRALELSFGHLKLSEEAMLDWLVGLQTSLTDEEGHDPTEVALVALSVLQSPKLCNNDPILALVAAPGRAEVDLVLPLGPWRLTGRIDKVLDQLESDGPSFVDWKTDSSSPEMIEEAYRPIMMLYAMALAKALPVFPPTVTGHLVCLRHGKIRTMKFDANQVLQTETEWTGLLETWRRRHASVKKLY